VPELGLLGTVRGRSEMSVPSGNIRAAPLGFQWFGPRKVTCKKKPRIRRPDAKAAPASGQSADVISSCSIYAD
jgi:hypothetical protein